MLPDAVVTIRQALRQLLQEQDYSLRELSQRLSLPEKEILPHLEQLLRRREPHCRWVIQPARCRRCGFVFQKRQRLQTPSRCPLCRHEGISAPRFFLECQAP